MKLRLFIGPPDQERAGDRKLRDLIMRIKKLGVQAALFTLLGMLSLIGAQAQTNTVGNISGTLRDQSGAVVPRAEIFIQEMRTGMRRTVTTNNEGLYSALSLPVGLYTISTTPQGYKKTVANGPEGKGLELHI